MSRRRKQAVGLCIGSHKIAVAQVHADAEGTVKVDRVSAIDTPDNAVYQGKITNPAAVAQAIRALLAQMDIGGVKEVSLAIPDEGSITRGPRYCLPCQEVRHWRPWWAKWRTMPSWRAANP